MTLSEIVRSILQLFGRPAPLVAHAVPVDASAPAAAPAPSPAPVPQPPASSPTLQSAPVPPLVSMAPVTAHPEPTWLDLCLPLTKHFESCQLIAYCDPASPRGRAITADGLWYAYLRDRTVGDRAKYASLDPTPWTCGWGQTGVDITKATVWTQAIADTRLVQRLQQAGREVDSLVKVKLTAGEKAALADFEFNEGEGNLSKSTLLIKVNASDFVGAAAEFMQWDEAGGRVVSGLEARRAANRQLFTTGAWKP